jgi:hypothetical protein
MDQQDAPGEGLARIGEVKKVVKATRRETCIALECPVIYFTEFLEAEFGFESFGGLMCLEWFFWCGPEASTYLYT